MVKINDLVNQIGLERKIVFVSLNNGSKPISEKLVAALDQQFIPNWCMYDGKGDNTNKGGDNYKKVIAENIKRTCLFVSLVSKDYIKSPEVEEEIYLILKESEACTRPNILFFPIFVDETSTDEFVSFIEDVLQKYHDQLGELAKTTAKTLIKNQIIHNTLDASLSNMACLCDDIKEQYLKSLTENIKRRIALIKNSNIFTDLLNLCIKQKCESNSVSEDIKKTQEIGSLEVHVISNELLDYDLNTYSLVVISSNLLGSALDVAPYFKPASNGTRYFYYLTGDIENTYQTLRDQLASFLKKDHKSRIKVSGLIRRDFCFKNRVLSYFKETFNNKSPEELASFFSCEKAADKIADFFDEDASRVFVISFGRQISFPNTVIDWLRGKPFNDASSLNEISSFVEFIKGFRDIISNYREEADKKRYDSLRRYCEYLDALKTLDDWQLGKLPNISKNKSRQLVRDLLNTNSSSLPNKQYPLIEDWLQFIYDEKGSVLEISDEIVQEALDNCSCIIVDDYSDDNKLIKLAYSFFFTIFADGAEGAWYTTGSRYDGIKEFMKQTDIGKEKENDDLFTLVTTYNITLQSDPCYNKLLEEFVKKRCFFF